MTAAHHENMGPKPKQTDRNRNANHKNHYAMDILDYGKGNLGHRLLLSCGVHTRIQKRILTHGNKGI
jgi:hypothetical protein